MNCVEKYHEEVRRYEAIEYIGYYPYKIVPISDEAKLVMAKQIKIDTKGDSVSLIGRILGLDESRRTIKKYLTDENLGNSRFGGKVEVRYADFTEAEKAYLKENIAKRMKIEYRFSLDYDFKIEIGEFVSYPPTEKLTFDDIQDLRAVN